MDAAHRTRARRRPRRPQAPVVRRLRARSPTSQPRRDAPQPRAVLRSRGARPRRGAERTLRAAAVDAATTATTTTSRRPTSTRRLLNLAPPGPQQRREVLDRAMPLVVNADQRTDLRRPERATPAQCSSAARCLNASNSARSSAHPPRARRSAPCCWARTRSSRRRGRRRPTRTRTSSSTRRGASSGGVPPCARARATGGRGARRRRADRRARAHARARVPLPLRQGPARPAHPDRQRVAPALPQDEEAALPCQLL